MLRHHLLPTALPKMRPQVLTIATLGEYPDQEQSAGFHERDRDPRLAPVARFIDPRLRALLGRMGLIPWEEDGEERGRSPASAAQ